MDENERIDNQMTENKEIVQQVATEILNQLYKRPGEARKKAPLRKWSVCWQIATVVSWLIFWAATVRQVFYKVMPL